MTIYDMPNNHLYQFTNDKYIWKVTMKDNYQNQSTLTEIYNYHKGSLEKIASGRLIDNPYTNRSDKVSIYNYADDTTYTYPVTMPLKEASLEIMYILRDKIAKNYKMR